MRANILSSALAASLEDLQDGEEINPVTSETVIEMDEVLEEVREAGEEVDGQDQVTEVLEEASDSLESLVVALEAAVAAGGMSPHSADIHGRAVNNIIRRLPIDKEAYAVSVESFGGTGDKLVASQEALDGAKDLLAKLWAGIKNAVANAWKAVVNFVTTLGKSAAAIGQAGKQLIASANQTKGAAAGKKVDATSVAKLLHTDGVMKGAVGTQLRVVVTNGAKVNAAATTAANGLKKLAGELASGHDSGEANAKVASEIMAALPAGALPGGKEIELNDSGMPKLVQKTSLKDNSVELDVPAIAEIKAIGQGIVAVADLIGTYDKKSFKALEASVTDFIAKQDKLVVKAGLDKAETEKVRAGLKVFKQYAGAARSAGPDYMAYAASAAKAAFGFGKKSLAQYS